MLRRAFQPSVKHHALLAPVGNHLDFPHYYVRAVRSAFHSRGVIIGKTRDGKLVAARLYMSDVDEAGRGIDAAVEGMAGKR